jgi:NAD(P)-dependent dehydrogenase (short-subunit alcohol dehydrogenase family)
MLSRVKQRRRIFAQKILMSTLLSLISIDERPSMRPQLVIKSYAQRLDVLVNNSAIADPADGPPSAVNPSVVQRVMETNFFGTLSVTQAMLPPAPGSAPPEYKPVQQMNGDPTWSFRRCKTTRVQHFEGGGEQVDYSISLRVPRYNDEGEFCESGLHGD